MYPSINTKDAVAVEQTVTSIFREMFPGADSGFLKSAFSWAIQCFNGHYKDYQSIDARYHDLEHTLQGTLCMGRLLRGRFLADAQPVISPRMFELGILAILLHDTGYLKKKTDTQGTGAKYTLVHVSRSTELAAELLREKNLSADEIKSVQNMIRCTGVNVDLSAIPFQNEVERLLGFALGTADLLGQMAASDYVEKLPILYKEFEECAEFNKGKMGSSTFASADDLMRKTPGFWEYYVQPKINSDFLGLYRFLSYDHPAQENWYMTRIEANISSLQQQLQAA